MACKGDCGICRLCLAPPVTTTMEKMMNDKSKKLAELANAVETLGSLIGDGEGRDAIHVAVLPVTAGETLHPAQHIGIKDGVAMTTATKLVGIVDPFLRGAVHTGQKFWMLLYPRTITSLRHVWSHPDFADEILPGVPAVSDSTVESLIRLDADDAKAASEAWLNDFAKRLFSYYANDDYERDYGSPLEVLILGLEHGGGFCTDIEYGDDVKPSEELFMHYERYTGKTLTTKPQYFRCAC